MIGIGDTIEDLKKRGVMVDIKKVLPEAILRRLDGYYPPCIPRVYAEAEYDLLDADLHPAKTIADTVFVLFKIGNIKYLIGQCGLLDEVDHLAKGFVDDVVAVTIYDYDDSEVLLSGYDKDMELVWVR